MLAGKLDRRIELQEQVAGVDENGQANGAWLTVATIWANFKPGTGKEFVAARVNDASAPATFEIRWRDSVPLTARILFDGQSYLILSAIPIGRRKGWQILAEALEQGA